MSLIRVSVVCYLTLLIVGCDAFNANNTPSDITATCTWTVYDHNIETFVINLSDEKVLWVEEEKSILIQEITSGYIKFSGIKSVMEGNGGTMVRNVNVTFKINRINGKFDSWSSQVKTDRVGNCILNKRAF